jgi:elongation factor P
LYQDGDDYHFMNTETYEQPVLSEEVLGDIRFYIRPQDTVDILTYNSEPIDIEIPPSVVLQVTETGIGVRGDTATNVTKPATLETGLTINVPIFVNQGDKVKVDTRTGQYVERAN